MTQFTLVFFHLHQRDMLIYLFKKKNILGTGDIGDCFSSKNLNISVQLYS